MCMLTFYPEGVQPDTEALHNGAETNNDGHGFAIVTREARNPIVRRYLDANVAIAEFKIMRKEYSDGPALFHSRWGTAGMRGLYNVHPFRVDRRTVMAHNGILPYTYQPLKGDPRCDTKLYAERILRGKDLSDPKVRNHIANTIGGGNKFVILSTRAGVEPAYIVNEASGVWDGDTWYSNEDYLGWRRYNTDKYTGSKNEGTWYVDEDGALKYIPPNSCRYCTSTDLDMNLDVCLSCDLCQECGKYFWSECDCFVPEWKKVIAS